MATANPSDNLFTDTGSPKYVNTSAILRQQPCKPRHLHPQYGLDERFHNRIARSPAPGRRDLQQRGPAKDRFGEQISKNLVSEFSELGVNPNREQNNRLLPVTTIQQVLYNNTSQKAIGLGVQLPQHNSNHLHTQLPIPQQHPMLQGSSPNSDVVFPDIHQSNAGVGPRTGQNMGNNIVQNHNSSSSSSTSSNFIPPLQKTPGIENTSQLQSGGDRIILERNLEKLITQKGLEVLGQLTAEMTHDQIERLLQKTKEKLGSNSANHSAGSPSEFVSTDSTAISRSRKPLDLDFTRNHDLDGYLSQHLQAAPATSNVVPHAINSHHRYGSQTSCPVWPQERNSFNSTPL